LKEFFHYWRIFLFNFRQLNTLLLFTWFFLALGLFFSYYRRNIVNFKFEQDSQTLVSVRTHSYSGQALWQYPYLTRSLLKVKLAAAHANHKSGMLTEDNFSSIAKRLDYLLSDHHAHWYPVDPLQGGGGIGINTNINDLIGIAGSNLSQSTADVVSTAGRIALKELSSDLAAASMKSIQLLEKLGNEYADTDSLARTCLQDASVTKFGRTFSGYAKSLLRSHNRISESTRALRVNLGGTTIGLSHGANEEYCLLVREELLKFCPDLEWNDDLVDAAQNSDDLLSLGTNLETLCRALLKITKDLRLYSSGSKGGFGQISLPKIINGSSFYTSKSNPTIPETVIQCCFQVLGLCRTAAYSSEHAELDLNIYESTAVINLYDATKILTSGITLLNNHCLSELEVNVGRCNELAKFAAKEDPQLKPNSLMN
jgi:aspartate ammonia-lyase